MFAVSESEQSTPAQSSPSRVATSSLPPQWSRHRKVKKTIPLFLRILLWVQRTSAILTLGSLGATLVVYGLTFYTQQQWNQQYNQLQKLQHQERNVTVINEALQDQIIKQESKENPELKPLTPDKNIYLAPVKDFSETDSVPNDQLEMPKTEHPFGY
jgi:hypothetical protein